MEALWDNDGGMINPTPFIQSTHNMAAATVALALGCKGYNMTYTNNSNSFESALLDGILYLNENPTHRILIGGLDEISEKTMAFWNTVGYVSSKNPQIPPNLNPETEGEVISEGTAFFVASSEKSKNCIGVVSAVHTKFEVENTEEFILTFLEDNGISVNDLDAVILGINGDSRYDGIYRKVSESIFNQILQIVYKNILGEFDTASSLAVEMALKFFQNQQIPEILRFNEIQENSFQRILIYNQRRGKNHSLILLENES